MASSEQEHNKPALEELFNHGGVTEDGVAYDGTKENPPEQPAEPPVKTD
jgi:hypothetical protein